MSTILIGRSEWRANYKASVSGGGSCRTQGLLEIGMFSLSADTRVGRDARRTAAGTAALHFSGSIDNTLHVAAS
jgi:hypothetical protein